MGRMAFLYQGLEKPQDDEKPCLIRTKYMEQINIYDLEFEDLKYRIRGYGEPEFRAG